MVRETIKQMPGIYRGVVINQIPGPLSVVFSTDFGGSGLVPNLEDRKLERVSDLSHEEANG